MNDLTYYKKQVSFYLQDRGLLDPAADELVRIHNDDVLYNFKINHDSAEETADYIWEQEYQDMI